MFVKTTSGSVDQYPYTIGQLRRDNPHTSFPKIVPDSILADYGVYPVTLVDRPQVDHTKNVTEGTPAFLNGSWAQTWNVADASEGEIESRVAKKSKLVRRERDQLLSGTDWVVIMHTEKGTNIPLDWEVYRQALRDITSHVNFPYLAEEDWPTKP